MPRNILTSATLAVLLVACSQDSGTQLSSGIMFKNPKLDHENALVVCTADCPPLGEIDLKFEIEGFDKNWSVTANQGGSSAVLTGVAALKGAVAERDFANIERLSENWSKVWPPVYEALMQKRKDYEYHAEVTKDNLLITITAPGRIEGIESENWSAGFELEEWDGYYYVEFDSGGTVVDSGVSF